MEIEKLIIVTILSGTFFCLGLVFILIGLTFSFRKKRILQTQLFEMQLKNKELDMMSAVVQAQEIERTKIAQNLHDEVGSILSMAQRNLDSTLKSIPNESEVYEDVNFVVDILEQSISKIRSISHSMLPHFLVKFGLIKTLERVCEQTEKTLGNTCKFEVSHPEKLALDQQQEIQIYSIVMELMNNLIKHAHPSLVNISLEIHEKNVLLSLFHNGVAINQKDYEYLLIHGEGIGLESIANRLNLLHGKITFYRELKGGKIVLEVQQTKLL